METASEAPRGDDARTASAPDVGSEEASPPQNPWASPRQDPVCGMVQPRVIPPVGKPTRHTNQLEHALDIVKALMKKKEAWPFLKPVDTIKCNIPDYHDVIKRPMDLTTIERRLKNVYYWSAKECLEDMMTLFNNCYTYNPPTFPIVQMARVLEQFMLAQLAKLPPEEIEIPRPSSKRGPKVKNSFSGGNPMRKAPPPKFPIMDEEGADPGPEHHRVLDQLHNAIVMSTERENSVDHVDGTSSLEVAADAASFPSPGIPSTSEEVFPKAPLKRKAPSVDLEPAAKMTTRRESGRPIKKPLHLQDYMPKARNRHKLSEQLKFCQKLLGDLFAKKNKAFTWPFLEPVDTVGLGLKDYLDVVKRPMDLGTIKHKLEERGYESAAEVHRDLEQVWTNCCLYNPPGDVIHEHGVTLKKFVTSKWKSLPPPDEDEGGGVDDDSKIDDLVLRVNQELSRYNNYCEVLTKYFKMILDIKIRRREATSHGRQPEGVSEVLQQMADSIALIQQNRPLDATSTRETSVAKSVSPGIVAPPAPIAAASSAPRSKPQLASPPVPEESVSNASSPSRKKAATKQSPPAAPKPASKMAMSSDSEESSTDSDDEPPEKKIANAPTPPMLMPEAVAPPPPANRRGRKPGSKNKPKVVEPPQRKVRDYPFDSGDEANKEIMKYEDRRDLTIQIYQLNDEQQKKVIDIISERESISFNPEEIEIDFETLKPATLHELAAYVAHVSKRRPRKPYTPKNHADAQNRKRMLVERIKKLGGVVPVEEDDSVPQPQKAQPQAPSVKKPESSSESSSSSSSSSDSDSSDSETEKAEKRASEWTSSSKKAAPPRSQPPPSQIKVEKTESSKLTSHPPKAALVQPPPKRTDDIPTEAPPSSNFVLPGARPLLQNTRPIGGAGISGSILDQLLPAVSGATNGDGTVKLSQEDAKASFNMFRTVALQKEERKRQLREEEERRRKAREVQQKETEAQKAAEAAKSAVDAKNAAEEQKKRIEALRKAEQEKRKRELMKNDVDMTMTMEMMANFEANF